MEELVPALQEVVEHYLSLVESENQIVALREQEDRDRFQQKFRRQTELMNLRSELDVELNKLVEQNQHREEEFAAKRREEDSNRNKAKLECVKIAMEFMMHRFSSGQAEIIPPNFSTIANLVMQQQQEGFTSAPQDNLTPAQQDDLTLIPQENSTLVAPGILAPTSQENSIPALQEDSTQAEDGMIQNGDVLAATNTRPRLPRRAKEPQLKETATSSKKSAITLDLGVDDQYELSADGTTYVAPVYVNGVGVNKENDTFTNADKTWKNWNQFVTLNSNGRRTEAENLREYFTKEFPIHPNQLVSENLLGSKGGLLAYCYISSIRTQFNRLQCAKNAGVISNDPLKFLRKRIYEISLNSNLGIGSIVAKLNNDSIMSKIYQTLMERTNGVVEGSNKKIRMVKREPETPAAVKTEPGTSRKRKKTGKKATTKLSTNGDRVEKTAATPSKPAKQQFPRTQEERDKDRKDFRKLIGELDAEWKNLKNGNYFFTG